MKNKIVMITAALAVMMALTGIAAADPSKVDIVPGDDSNPLYHPLHGSTITYSVGVTEMIGSSRLIEVYNTGLDTVTLSGTGMSDLTVAAGSSGNTAWTATIPSQTLSLDVTTNSAGAVTIQTCVTGDLDCNNPGTRADFGAGTNQFDIPEFSTIALPVAAVLGLVFFFQQRKNKKE